MPMQYLITYMAINAGHSSQMKRFEVTEIMGYQKMLIMPRTEQVNNEEILKKKKQEEQGNVQSERDKLN